MYSIARRIAPTSSPGGSGTDGSKSSLCAIAVHFNSFKLCKSRDGSHGQLKVVGVDFQTDAVQAQKSSGRDGGTRAHKWIEDHPVIKRQGGTDNLAQKRLGFQGRMGSGLALEAS